MIEDANLAQKNPGFSYNMLHEAVESALHKAGFNDEADWPTREMVEIIIHAVLTDIYVAVVTIGDENGIETHLCLTDDAQTQVLFRYIVDNWDEYGPGQHGEVYHNGEYVHPIPDETYDKEAAVEEFFEYARENQTGPWYSVESEKLRK